MLNIITKSSLIEKSLSHPLPRYIATLKGVAEDVVSAKLGFGV